MQAQLADFLSLYCLVGSDENNNNIKAFKKLCKGLYEIGVTAAMIRQKKKETLKIFEPQDTADTFLELVGNFSGEETRNVLTEYRIGNRLGLVGFDHQWIF